MTSSKEDRVLLGMRVGDNSTTDELLLWRLMHENGFFHKERIIKADDVKNTLCHTPSPSEGQPSMDRPVSHPPTPTRARTPTLSINTAHHNDTATDTLHHLGLPLTPHLRPTSIPPSILKYTPEIPTPKPTPVTGAYRGRHVLLRRPRPPRDQPRRPLNLPQIIKPLLAEDEFGAWRVASFTTLARNDPMDPNAYYNRNFPILLKQIPRRHINLEENCNEWYRPMETPEISTSYFAGLKGSPLSVGNMASHRSLNQLIVYPPAFYPDIP